MKGRKEILKAMHLIGHDILEEDYEGFIVSMFDDKLLFSEPQVLIGEIEEDIKLEHKRFDFERVSCMFLCNHDEVTDCQVMYCIAQMFILNPDRGMLRHVIDWPNSSNIKCQWYIVEREESERID